MVSSAPGWMEPSVPGGVESSTSGSILSSMSMESSACMYAELKYSTLCTSMCRHIVKSYGLACGLDNYSTLAVICARSIVCAHWTLYSILQVTELLSGLHSRVSSIPYCFKVDLAISTLYTLNLTVVCIELRL
jgi:hypothetical protein